MRHRLFRSLACVALLLGLLASPVRAVAAPLFTDGFESGGMAAWNKSIGITPQQGDVRSGSWAARATSASSASWAWKGLPSTQTQLYFDTWFKVTSRSTSMFFLRTRTATGTLIASLGINTSNRLYLRNDVSGANTTSTTTVTQGVWHEAQLRVLVNGSSSQTEVWLDGVRIPLLSITTSLGSTPIGRIQIGDNGSRTYSVLFDDATADMAFIGGGGGDTTPPSTPAGLSASASASNRIELTWSRSPEADVAGYTLYRNSTLLTTVSGATNTSYSDGSVSPNTTYSYTVDAFDAAQPPNHSPQSAPASVTTPPGPGGDPVVAAAGDIACDPMSGAYNGGAGTSARCHMNATADVLENLLATTPTFQSILALGDNQYECGGLQAFNQSYAQSWGRPSLKAITKPVPGDEEYATSGGTDCSSNAAGYFAYFGAAAGDPAKGYYSFDVGAWHLIALNSECREVGGCGVASPQYAFLQSDLASHPAACALAYWQKPRFTSSKSGGSAAVGPFWDLLYAAGAEIVLGGNHHVYERFREQTPAQVADDNAGIRSFTVGTGGNSLAVFDTIQPNSQVRNNTTYGVLKLTLHPSSYDWQFLPEAGKTFTDSGTDTCH